MGHWIHRPVLPPFACSTCGTKDNPPFHVGREYLLAIDTSGAGQSLYGKWTTCRLCAENLTGADGTPFAVSVMGANEKLAAAERLVDHLTARVGELTHELEELADAAPGVPSPDVTGFATAVAQELASQSLEVRRRPGRPPKAVA